MTKRRYLLALIAVAAVIALVAVMLATGRGAKESSLPAAGGRAMTVSLAGVTPYYLQNDPQWGAETIGGSDEPMAGSGCTVACVAMGLSALGHQMDPSQVCAELKQQGGFTAQGLIIWSKVGGLTNGAVEVGVRRLSYEAIDAELTARRPVIAKIMLAETVPHWVLIVGKEGREYLALDPLNQQRKVIKVSSRSRGIYAIRVFRGRWSSAHTEAASAVPLQHQPQVVE
jgi:hypothetical protein